MRIIYITTSIDQNDYIDFVKLWKKAPNPSNQNFHNKLIRSIAINNRVDVISIRPFSKKLCKTRKLKAKSKDSINNFISWHYLAVNGSKIFKFSNCKKQSMHIMKSIFNKDEDFVIMTDTINPVCIYIANAISKTYSIPTVGICTDSPSNITGTNKTYTLYLLKQAAKCYGYISLTNELSELYNPNNRKTLIIEGIVEDKPDTVNTIGVDSPYFFFAGALLEKYGIYNLIEAYKSLKTNKVDLYICGHSGNPDKIKEAIASTDGIHFLGTIPVQNVLKYEANALANINPRPYSEDFDRYSIPSKTIEYLSSGRPTISVKNTKLMKYFKEEAIWVKTNEVEDLAGALKIVMSLNKDERMSLGEKAKEKAFNLYSLKAVNNKINEFLEGFKTRIN